MIISTSTKGRQVVLRLQGELDLAAADQFRSAADRAAAETACRHLIVNLSRTTFIDSVGLGALLGRYRRLKEMGGELSLVAPTPAVASVLRMGGLLRLVSVYATEADALSRAGGGEPFDG